MTLKEIEKLIDEADYVGYPKLSKMIDFYPIDNKENEKEKFRHANDDHYVFHYEDGEILYYYKLNKETGEITFLGKVDHIDKEKKIVKKKLGEMTDEEIENIFKNKECKKHSECSECYFEYNCPLTYLHYKNTEIEFEAEE